MKNETLTANTEQELEQLINDYKRKYPEAGYGTTFTQSYFHPQNQKWTVHVKRFETCD